MYGGKLAGGPTQDEIMAVSLFKLGLKNTDTVLEIGCGTGKVSLAIAGRVSRLTSLDIRPEAIALAQDNAGKAGAGNIEFLCVDAREFLNGPGMFDCAFLGGTKGLEAILPILAKKTRRAIVINAVMLSTIRTAVDTLKSLGLFTEVVQVQVSRSHDIASSIMFQPLDPVFIIVGRGAACS